MADADEGETPNNDNMLSPEATGEQSSPGVPSSSPFAPDSRQVDRNRSDSEDEGERRMSNSRRRYLEEAEEATREANRRADPGVEGNSASEEAALRAKALAARRRREAAEEELRRSIDQLNRLDNIPDDGPSDRRSGRNPDTRGDGRGDRNSEPEGAGVGPDNVRRQGTTPHGEARDNSSLATQSSQSGRRSQSPYEDDPRSNRGRREASTSREREPYRGRTTQSGDSRQTPRQDVERQSMRGGYGNQPNQDRNLRETYEGREGNRPPAMSRSSNDNRGSDSQSLDAQLDEYRRSSSRNTDNRTRANNQEGVRNDRSRDEGNDDNYDSRERDDRRGGYRQIDTRNVGQSGPSTHGTENRSYPDRTTDSRQDDNRDSGQRANAQLYPDNRNTRDTRGAGNVRSFEDGYDDDDRHPDRPRPRDQGGDNFNPPRQARRDQQSPERDTRKRKSPPQEGPETRKQRSPPRDPNRPNRSPSGEQDYNTREVREPPRERDRREPQHENRASNRQQAYSPGSFYVRDSQGNMVIDYEELNRHEERVRQANRNPDTSDSGPRLAAPTPIRQSDETRRSDMRGQGRGSPVNLSFERDMYAQEMSGSALTNSSQQRQPALWGTQSTIALQQLRVLNVNEEKKIIDSTANH